MGRRATQTLAWWLPVQGAYLINNIGDTHTAYWSGIPNSIFWPMIVLATAASIVASQVRRRVLGASPFAPSLLLRDLRGGPGGDPGSCSGLPASRAGAHLGLLLHHQAGAVGGQSRPLACAPLPPGAAWRRARLTRRPCLRGDVAGAGKGAPG